jgi:hypothetical protein
MIREEKTAEVIGNRAVSRGEWQKRGKNKGFIRYGSLQSKHKGRGEIVL